MSVTRLNLTQIREGIYECIDVSRELMNEAKYLARKKSFGIASSLLLLAVEETGKAVLIYRTILLDKEDENAWSEFWSNYKDHRIKLLAGFWRWSENFFNLHWDTQFGKSIEETQREGILWLNATKQQGFYTFFDEKNKIFKKPMISPLEYVVIDWCANMYSAQLCELKKCGFFTQGNLNKLRSIFMNGEGKTLLQKYRNVRRLKTLPDFKEKYERFLERSGLGELKELQHNAIRNAVLSSEFLAEMSIQKKFDRAIKIIRKISQIFKKDRKK